MALACLAAEAEHAGDKLARQGFALVDGSGVALRAAVAAFDALLGEGPGPAEVAPDDPLVAALVQQGAVRELLAEAIGPGATVVRARAFDLRSPLPVTWHQPGTAETARGLILHWHLDLIGPADGGLRVLPRSHAGGRLSAKEVTRLAGEIPAVELAVSAGTVLALRPLLVQGTRRRTTRGHRRFLQVELAAGDPPAPLDRARA